MKKTVVVITGPTAVGKTDLSVKVAEEVGAEIVSADSMQVYRYMDIGTAKPTPAERVRAMHHMIDIVDPWQEFSVAKYQQLAKMCIKDIQDRGKIPLIVGGTGLYINSLTLDLNFADTISDHRFRAYLKSLAEERGKDCLFDILCTVDPDTAQRLHENDLRRVIRALEVYYCSGKPMSAIRDNISNTHYDLIMFGLGSERQRLYKRIENRVDEMIKAGLVQEVKGLIEMGCTERMAAMQGLGYKEIIRHLKGELTLNEGADLIKRNTRRFAKRQFTWFRRDDRIIWKDIDGDDDGEDVKSEVIDYIKLRLRA